MYKFHVPPRSKKIKLELHKKTKWSNQIKRWLQNDKHFKKLIMHTKSTSYSSIDENLLQLTYLFSSAWQYWWLPCTRKSCANVTTAMVHRSHKNANHFPILQALLPHPASLHTVFDTFLSTKPNMNPLAMFTNPQTTRARKKWSPCNWTPERQSKRCETTSKPGTTSSIKQG